MDSLLVKIDSPKVETKHPSRQRTEAHTGSRSDGIYDVRSSRDFRWRRWSDNDFKKSRSLKVLANSEREKNGIVEQIELTPQMAILEEVTAKLIA